MPLVVVQPSAGSNPCASCKALYGATCCEAKADDGPAFPLTYAEAGRIAKYHGMPLEEAVDIQKVDAVAQQALLASAGVEIANMIVDGVGLYLPRRENGACRYLGKSGCMIPFLKPYICAMFPFSEYKGKWIIGRLVGETGYCFGQDAAGLDRVKALEIFGQTEAALNLIKRHWDRDRKTHKALMGKLRRRT